jgi:hypothetical protein
MIEPKFTDVKKTDWFYGEVKKAVKYDYMIGSKGKINSNSNMNRQELAVVLARLGKLDTIVDIKVLNKLTDVKSIPDWGKGAISAALSKSLFEDFVTTTFKPTQNVSRLEVVVVLDRLLTLLGLTVELPVEIVPGGIANIPTTSLVPKHIQ